MAISKSKRIELQNKAAKSMKVTKTKSGAMKMNQISGIYVGKDSTYRKKPTTTAKSAIKKK